VAEKAGLGGSRPKFYVPNAAIKALGVARCGGPVLDCRLYLIRLDGELNIVAYGPKELVLEGEG